MSTSYPNIIGQVKATDIEHFSPSTSDYYWWDPGSSHPVYLVIGGSSITAISERPNFDNWYYKFTGGPESYRNLRGMNGGTVTVPAGKYFTIMSYGPNDDIGTENLTLVQYAVTNCTFKVETEKYSGSATYKYYVYLISGSVDQFFLKINESPTIPTINVPSTIYGGQSLTLNWAQSNDPDGVAGYELERRWDGTGVWTQVYKGSSTSYSDSIPKGEHTSVAYRVRAYDTYNVYSDYSTGATRTIINNTAPNTPGSITVPDTVRGGADIDISWSAVTDPDGNLDGYIVERSYNGGSSWAQIYQGRATSTTTTIPFGTQTVTFRVCAYDTYGEKSGWRTSANKTVVNNRAPTAPPSISVPLSPAGGDKLTITWTASTDADGNLEGYELERQWDGTGAFTQIYKGAALSFQDDIPKAEHTSVVYRVRAYDSFASYSSYTTSPSRTIDNNTAPVIACDLSGDLGEKSEGFSVPYTVSDAEQQEVTVVEKVGDLVKRTYTVTLNQQNTFEVTGEYFQKILNGAQAVQIVATDSAGKTSTLELTFTKAVHKAVITLSEPLAVEEQITVAVLAITGKIPADATQLIELTNNGNDPEPVWEDATADVKAGRNYVFKNKSQSAGWAFNFRVTVERGESGEDGNIVSIQGGFQ